MTSIPVLRLISLAALACLGAAAGAAEPGYPYVGLSLGESKAKIDDVRITSSLLGAGFTTTGMTNDERGKAYRVFGGYQFNANLAVEGGYFSLGQFGFTSTTVPAGSLTGQIRLHGLNLDLVGTLPLAGRLSVIGRIGAQYARARDGFSGTGAVLVLRPNPSKSELNAKAGLGLQYGLTPSVLVRLEAEHYRINDAVGNHGGVNAVLLSLVFPFGRTPTEAPRAAAAPPAPIPIAAPPAPPPAVVYTAPPPPPAPVVQAAAVVAPERRRVSFSADSLFGFDQSEVRPDGRAALDTFSNELRGTRFEVIRVEGHTDRLGSQAYNQKLSLRRAESVKAYLVQSAGIDSAKFDVTGKGETAPTTRPEDCKGKQQTAGLIACLQPDRRVDVEVVGTR
jgi:OOP family OmpA-OmpF porin